MISYDEARDRALAHCASFPIPLVLAESRTEEHPWGWVFYPLPQRYVHSGQVQDLVLGLSPICVSRVEGRVEWIRQGSHP